MDGDETKRLPAELELSDDAADAPTRSRRPSTSTVASRRQNAYDSQRINRRSRPDSSHSQSATAGPSRPISTTSRATSKSFSKRYSAGQHYQLPDDLPKFDDEFTLGSLTSPEDRSSARDSARAGLPTKNFSQRDVAHTRTTSAPTHRSQATDTTALPPVPDPKRSSMPVSTSSKRNLVDRRPDSVSSKGRRPAPRPRTEKEIKIDSTPPVNPWLSHLYAVSYLIFFSIWGTLARLGIQWITFYPGAPTVTPVIWANCLGSFILGFLVDDHILFRDTARASLAAEKPANWEDHIDKDEINKKKKALPLYIGLAVGFCGCLTSFSSFLRDVFLALSNNLPTPVNYPFNPAPQPSFAVGRHDGYSVEALLGVIFLTLALSFGGLLAGGHLANALDPYLPSMPVSLTRKFLDPLVVVLGWGCWLAALLLTIFPPDRPGGPDSLGSWMNEVWRGQFLFAILFAPVGCLLRWYASLQLNPLVGTFPLGTFAVNMLGTAVEGMCYDIQHVGIGVMGVAGGGMVGCQVLQGVMDGFCGSLTTVSSFVAEAKALRRSHGYVYVTVSVAGALGLMVIIMGSVRWTVGFGDPVCNTGYTNKVHA